MISGYENRYLEISESKWFKMTTQQRERHIQKVNSTLLTQISECETNFSKSCSLSVSAEQFHSRDQLKGIRNKALSQPAPGCERGIQM